MTYLLYILVKLACYTAWVWLGLRLWQPDAATAWRALGLGMLRLGIGVCFGVVIFFEISTDSYGLFWKYIAIYTPVRMVEWYLMAVILRRNSTAKTPSATPWCLGGIVVSFAADLASPEGLAGHFCVGRCLC